MDSEYRPRITDYDLADLIDTSQFTSAGGSQSAAWTAPELIEYDDESSGDENPYFTAASDMFAFAMLCIEASYYSFDSAQTLWRHDPLYNPKAIERKL